MTFFRKDCLEKTKETSILHKNNQFKNFINYCIVMSFSNLHVEKITNCICFNPQYFKTFQITSYSFTSILHKFKVTIVFINKVYSLMYFSIFQQPSHSLHVNRHASALKCL